MDGTMPEQEKGAYFPRCGGILLGKHSSLQGGAGEEWCEG